MADKKLVASGAVVKIKALRAIGLVKRDAEGRNIHHIYNPGDTLEVSEDVAAEYCDKSFNGTLEKQMQITSDYESIRPKIVRAQRI